MTHKIIVFNPKECPALGTIPQLPQKVTPAFAGWWEKQFPDIQKYLGKDISKKFGKRLPAWPADRNEGL